VWGEDIILDSPEFIDHSQAVALTYVEAYTLRRDELDEVLEEYPEAKAHVRKAAHRVTMQRALLKYLAVMQGKPGPASFAPSSTAKGYVTVPPTAKTHEELHFKTMDHKVCRAAVPTIFSVPRAAAVAFAPCEHTANTGVMRSSGGAQEHGRSGSDWW
jgi:hypothetical protein